MINFKPLSKLVVATLVAASTTCNAEQWNIHIKLNTECEDKAKQMNGDVNAQLTALGL